jgi:hypothetical protein
MIPSAARVFNRRVNLFLPVADVIMYYEVEQVLITASAKRENPEL